MVDRCCTVDSVQGIRQNMSRYLPMTKKPPTFKSAYEECYRNYSRDKGAKAQPLTETQKQLAAVQEYIRSGEALRDGNRQRAARASAVRPAVKAAKAKTADETAGEVISFGVELLGPVVAGIAFFACLAAGPPGWLLLIVLCIAVSSNDSSSSRKRRKKPKVTGFYCPYYPSR